MNSTSTLDSKCFDESSLILMMDVEKKINNFIFPVQFVITVVGNLLTMTVLLNGHSKNRANHLLAFLALCDMLVFFMMFSHYLASLDKFANSTSFRLFYFKTKPHFGALTNWFSAAAIWFVLAVSLERLLIIMFPFRSLDSYSSKQVIFVSFVIMVSTFILTSYHHFSHHCLSFVVCHNTQVVGRCYSNSASFLGKRANPASELFKGYLKVSVVANVILAVLLPIFAVAVLNITLIRVVKRRNSEELLVRNSMPSNLQDQERKMTHTVLAIISCFTLTQAPSALVYIYHTLCQPTEISNYMSVITNQLVLTGKMLNVVLFCLTSKTFRRRLCNTFRFWFLMIFYLKGKHARGTISRTQSKSMISMKTSMVYTPSRKSSRPEGQHDGRKVATASSPLIKDTPMNNNNN